jgi:hypothetical protein
MRKILFLGMLLVFALSVQVSSRNHPVISKSGTETFSVAPTQQEKPVIPKKDTSKAKTVAKLPAWMGAIDNILDAARQTMIQEKRFWRELGKIIDDPQWQRDPVARTSLERIKAFVPNASKFGEEAEALAQRLRQRFAQINAK